MNDTTYELAVIGGGIAGAAAALRAGQYGIETAWILGDKKTAKASRSQWVRNVDNMIGVHPGIMLAKLRKAWKKRPELLEALEGLGEVEISTRDIIANVHERLEVQGDSVREVAARATEVDRGEDGCFTVTTESAELPTLRARHVVLATGAMDRQPRIAKPKGDEVVDDPKWIYPFANRETILYCIRCEGHLTRDRPVGVIGAGESAGQIALMLAERYQSACCVFPNGDPVEMGEGTRRLLDHHGVKIHEGRITDVHSEEGERGKLRALELEDGQEYPLHFALVSMGMYRVYNDLAVQLGAELVDPEKEQQLRRVAIDHRGETTVPGLFAIGDMAKRHDEGTMLQIYTAQEYAVRAVDTVDRRRRKRERDALLAELG
jgi:thioredoxin reductase (NADPH)